MGQIEKKQIQNETLEIKDTNPLLPGAIRSNGQINPSYSNTYVFDNDFPALIDDINDNLTSFQKDELFRVEPARGRCRVMCFHPRTDMTLPLMSINEIEAVISTWISEYKELSSKYNWIQIFENKGTIMGCSNPHPHCQIWASEFIPNEAKKKDETQRKYYQEHKRPMLMDYVHKELSDNAEERVILKNQHWVVLVPFWAIWPFETMIIAHHRHLQRLVDLFENEKESLALIIKLLLIKYDNLFQTSFPYSMAWHGMFDCFQS